MQPLLRLLLQHVETRGGKAATTGTSLARATVVAQAPAFASGVTAGGRLVSARHVAVFITTLTAVSPLFKGFSRRAFAQRAPSTPRVTQAGRAPGGGPSEGVSRLTGTTHPSISLTSKRTEGQRLTTSATPIAGEGGEAARGSGATPTSKGTDGGRVPITAAATPAPRKRLARLLVLN